jgi:hypothetical protein
VFVMKGTFGSFRISLVLVNGLASIGHNKQSDK